MERRSALRVRPQTRAAAAERGEGARGGTGGAAAREPGERGGAGARAPAPSVPAGSALLRLRTRHRRGRRRRARTGPTCSGAALEGRNAATHPEALEEGSSRTLGTRAAHGERPPRGSGGP